MRRPLLLSVLLLASCDPIGGESDRFEARPAVAPPMLSPVEILPPRIERSRTGQVTVRNPLAVPAVQVDSFLQGRGRVDILWVIDDSGSMKNQRATLADNFERFLEALLSYGTNFQMGVISTNALDFGELRGTVRIIRNDTPELSDRFRENTTFPDSRTRWENGLRMAQIALSPPAIDGANAGFLRDDAALAVIVVSDEDDSSFGDTSHYARYLRGRKGKGNENLVTFSTIGGTTPTGCYPPGEQIYWGGLAEPAFRYAAVSTKTGGVIGSICDASFEDTLRQIAAAISTLRRIFPLSVKPDPSTLRVFVDDVAIPRDAVNGWSYREESQSVAFLGNYVPHPGARVRFEYAIVP